MKKETASYRPRTATSTWTSRTLEHWGNEIVLRSSWTYQSRAPSWVHALSKITLFEDPKYFRALRKSVATITRHALDPDLNAPRLDPYRSEILADDPECFRWSSKVGVRSVSVDPDRPRLDAWPWPCMIVLAMRIPCSGLGMSSSKISWRPTATNVLVYLLYFQLLCAPSHLMQERTGSIEVCHCCSSH